ncbi:MAG: hypothetical protein CVV02_17465 [Firmicutes bacterium HGW-Firmicutes-7]|nr:MAG: hypothetical protein CVV02_17465 [Firmicutes bacterium HGW-Firmicutes-7]
MKLIDNKGKLFGKLHILDIVVVLIFVAVVLGAINKFSGGNLISFDGGTKEVNAEIWVETIEYRPMYLESLKVGDIIAEDKKYLDGKIVEVEIIDYMVSGINNEGSGVVGPHPFYKKAKVKIEAIIDYKEPIYSFGKQEIREGAGIFLTTETSNLSVLVTDFKILQ